MAVPITQTKKTIPTAGDTFFDDLQNFLADEDAERFKDYLDTFIQAGGTHVTGAGLVHTPDSLTAYPGGFFITETGSITYPDSVTHLWVICHKDTATAVTDWTRESGTHYLFRNTGSATPPTLPTDTAFLMKVTTAGGAVSAVQDARLTSATGFVSKTTNPLVTDDVNLQYTVPYLWVNTATPEGFILTDSTAGAAVWQSFTVTAASVNAAGAIMHTDISETEGFLRKTASETYVAIKSNLTATVNPIVTDDTNAGYAASSKWINTSTNQLFELLDATAGSAVWRELSTEVPTVGLNTLVPHDSLVITQTAVTTVDIDAVAVDLRKPGGFHIEATPIDLTVDITASGINGLDTGSEASSTQYAIYAIQNSIPISTGVTDSTTTSKLVDSTADFVTDGVKVGDAVLNATDGTTVVVTVVDSLTTLTVSNDVFVSGENYEIKATAGILSENFGKPTLPASYDFFGLIGSVFNDSSSDFVGFKQRGENVRIVDTQVLVNGSATSPTSVDLNTVAPHGFWPTMGIDTTSERHIVYPVAGHEADLTPFNTNLGASQLQRFVIGREATGTLTVRQRFVQASPPYDMGDGEVCSFIFAIINNSTGLVESYYHASDPPWANNGPTNIRSERIDKATGKHYRRNLTTRTDYSNFMDSGFLSEEEIEITNEFKNADMDLIPHPFQGNDLTGKTVVLFDPMCKEVERFEGIKNAGGQPSEIIYGDYLHIDNSELGRARPPGVMSVAVRMK